jgi:hypothetical protein
MVFEPIHAEGWIFIRLNRQKRAQCKNLCFRQYYLFLCTHDYLQDKCSKSDTHSLLFLSNFPIPFSYSFFLITVSDLFSSLHKQFSFYILQTPVFPITKNLLSNLSTILGCIRVHQLTELFIQLSRKLLTKIIES